MLSPRFSQALLRAIGPTLPKLPNRCCREEDDQARVFGWVSIREELAIKEIDVNMVWYKKQVEISKKLRDTLTKK